MWKRFLSYLWGRFYRDMFQPGRWVVFLFGIFFGSLLTEANPFKVAFFTGPLLLRIATWIGIIGLFVSMCKLVYRTYKRRWAGKDIYQPASQLNDWQINQHWLSFDRIVEIAKAPNLLEPQSTESKAGWEPNDCILSDIGEFHNAPRLESNYIAWCKQIDQKKLEKDGTKYVLVNHPDSETDEHFVRLQLQRTKWSRVQAFLHSTNSPYKERNVLFQAADPKWSGSGKPKIDLTVSEAPHSLCMHGVVITKDRKILALQRPGPNRTDYHPYAWSFSFEEQLSIDDFNTQKSRVDVSEWLHRGVRQEVLGNKEVDKYFNVDKARVLAIAIEEEIFNPFLVAYIPVECESYELVKFLPHAPDHIEWLQYDFYSVDPPFDNLANVFKTNKHIDGNSLHPTSRYRLYLALSVILPPTVADLVLIPRE